MSGSLMILGCFVLGVLLAWLGWIPDYFLEHDGTLYVLYVLMFLVGISIGHDRRLGEILRTLRPRVVDVIKMDGHRLEEQTAHSVAVYFALYMLCIGALLVALSFSPFDMETNLFSSVSCFNNVGPAFGMAGPGGNYSLYQPVLKLLLCVGMLLGRLEIYPMLLLFVPAAWRRK